jgi:hypothetical protein
MEVTRARDVMWNCRGRIGHQARLQGESIRSSPLATAIRRDLTNKNVSKQAHCVPLLFWISGDLVRISGSKISTVVTPVVLRVRAENSLQRAGLCMHGSLRPNIYGPFCFFASRFSASFFQKNSFF